MASEDISTHYRVRAKFASYLNPRSEEFHDVDFCSTLEEVEKALDEIKRNPGYKEAEVRRFDVRFVNGRSVGAVNPRGEVVKTWKRKAGK